MVSVEHKNLNFMRRLGFALSGIRQAWKMEKSFRFQTMTALLLLLFCVFARPSLFWCAIFSAMAAVVLSLELVNTAFEAVLDKLHPEKDDSVGFAKDCLAGAVLVASLISVLIFVLYLCSTMT